MNISHGIVLILGVICLVTAASADSKATCSVGKVEFDERNAGWRDMWVNCTSLMRDQVQVELEASLTYMAMGAHFARDTVNRPGFSKMFFESANEEREHAIKIMSYLLMRGELTKNVADLIQLPEPVGTEDDWATGLKALNHALALEVQVTKRIRNIIKKCENDEDEEVDKKIKKKNGDKVERFNDYQLVDYLTADFLEEQYSGQRDLAGKIQTLGKMMNTQGALGEFLFDKKLLSGPLL